MNYDPTNNISWQLGYRGRVAVFIDGNNLFHAARFHNIDIGEIADKVRKEPNHSHRYYENHTHEQQSSFAGNTPARARGEEINSHAQELLNGDEEERNNARRAEEFDETVPQLLADPGLG